MYLHSKAKKSIYLIHDSAIVEMMRSKMQVHYSPNTLYRSDCKKKVDSFREK